MSAGNTATPAARRLTWADYKTLSLSALGGALEFYDFIIFVFFANTMGKLFFPSAGPEWIHQLQTFGLFAAGYLARPLGGIVMAHFGDLLGRKKMFTLSIFLMAVPTLCMGLLPTYAQIGLWAPLLLLLLRIVQGAAIGGEVPGAWVFVSEHVSSRFVGYACGTLTAGLTAGILIGSLVASLINSLFSNDELLDYAWRIPFLLGGVFGLFAVFLRRWLEETPVFAELKLRKQLADQLPLGLVVREHRGAVMQSMLLTWLLSTGVVVLVLMTPAILESQGLASKTAALQANSLAIVCLSLSCILAGVLVDRFKAAPILIIGCLLLGGFSWLFYALLPSHPDWLFPLYALVGFSVGVIGVVPYIMVNAFPAAVRFTGLSFSYNLAYAITGGLTPIVLTLMLKQDALAPAYYVAGVSLIGILVGINLWRQSGR